MIRRVVLAFILLIFFTFPVNAEQKQISPLKVSGNQIVRVSDNKPISLVGLALYNGVFNDKGGASENMPSWVLDEKDLILFKTLGINVVRYCFSYKWFLQEKWLDVFDKHLRLFEKYKIYVILNMHVPPGSGNNWGTSVGDELFSKKNWELFLNVWKKVVSRFKGRPIIAAYEPFSEPKPENYEQLVKKTNEVVSAIRQIEKDDNKQHIVVVANPVGLRTGGKTIWEFHSLFKLIDKNILYTFHFYEPWAFTHQPEPKEIYWLSSEEKKKLPKEYKYPTQCFWIKGKIDKKSLEETIKKYVAWADKNNVPLYLGEFGLTNRAPIKDKCKWIKDILEIVSKYKIKHWTYWCYKEVYAYRYGFSLVNVLPEDIEKKDIWEQNHFKSDTIKVNSMNKLIFKLLFQKHNCPDYLNTKGLMHEF